MPKLIFLTSSVLSTEKSIIKWKEITWHSVKNFSKWHLESKIKSGPEYMW